MEGVSQFAVVIPAYNYGRYLPEAIDSVLAQEGATFELVVVDDGSTDDTPAIVERYGNAVSCFRQRNSGPYVACKRGIERTRGEFIVMLDADDRLRPGALAHAAAKLAEQRNAQLLFGPWITLRPDGSRRCSTVPRLSADRAENFRRYIDGSLKVSAGGAVFHREVFERIRDVPEPFFYGYDRVMVGQALAWHQAAGTDQPLFDLRAHDHRMRDDVVSMVSAGTRAADALFAPAMIPPELSGLRPVFEANLLLEQARLLYHHARFAEARDACRKAFAVAPSSALRLTHLKRFFKAFARSLVRAG